MPFISDASIIIALTGLITSICSYLAGRRLRHAETVSKEIDNMQKAIHTWRELVDFQANEILRLDKKITELNTELRNIELLQNERIIERCKTCPYRSNH
jgi:peptidoglycan hydrolase CwlO-like protein